MKLNAEAISTTHGRPYLERRKRHWNWRKAAESLLVVLAVAFVAFGLPLMLFVSCTNGR